MVLTDSFYPDPSYLIPVHESLFEAIAAGDADRAETLAFQHNNDSGEKLSKFLESHPDAYAQLVKRTRAEALRRTSMP